MSKSYSPIEIPLEVPVDLDGQQLTKLTMRPPKGADVINASDMAASDNYVDAMLFANLCNVPMSTILGLEYYDYKQCEAAYDRFLYPVQIHCEMQLLPLSSVLEHLTLFGSPNSTPINSQDGSVASSE